MAVNKKSLPAPRKFSMDPAVEAVITQSDDPIYGSMERRQRARNMTTAQRKKAERDRSRTKVTYDFPPELIEHIKQVAQEESIPPGHLAALLVKMGLDALECGSIDLKAFKVPSRNARYEWFLNLSKERYG